MRSVESCGVPARQRTDQGYGLNWRLSTLLLRTCNECQKGTRCAEEKINVPLNEDSPCSGILILDRLAVLRWAGTREAAFRRNR